jgi:hypothetical protein
MAEKAELSADPQLRPIARALGYLCIHAAGLHDAPLAHAVPLLERLGFARADCAEILGTTTETIRVTMAKKKQTVRKGKSR